MVKSYNDFAGVFGQGMLDHGGSAKEEWQTLGVAGGAAGVVYTTDDQTNVLQFHGGQ